jgi:hypothetical protein
MGLSAASKAIPLLGCIRRAILRPNRAGVRARLSAVASGGSAGAMTTEQAEIALVRLAALLAEFDRLATSFDSLAVRVANLEAAATSMQEKATSSASNAQA